MSKPLDAIAGLFKAAAMHWVKDHAQSMGAALAFYTIFSIAPLLVIVIAIAGSIFGEEAARGEIYSQLQGMLGSHGAAAVQGLLESVGRRSDSAPAAALGAVVLFVGATSVFAELQDALDRIWRAPQRARRAGLWSLVRARLLSFGMVLGITFLLIVSLAFSAAMRALSRWWDPGSTSWITFSGLTELSLNVVLLTAVFAMIYKTMPRASIAWRDVWVGAAVTSVLFIAGKALIGLYIGRSGITTLFGAAASLIVVLLWVYYSAQIFLFGAEFTWVYSHRYGSRRLQALLDVDVPRVQRVGLDELPPRLHFVAHQRREDLVGADRVLDLHAQHAAHGRIHRRFPQLAGIHLAEPLVALAADRALGLLHQPVHRLGKARDRRLLLLVAAAADDPGAGADQALERARRGVERGVVGAVHEVGVDHADLHVAVVAALDPQPTLVASPRRAVRGRATVELPSASARRCAEASALAASSRFISTPASTASSAWRPSCAPGGR